MNIRHGEMSVGIVRIERHCLLGRLGTSRQSVVLEASGDMKLRRLEQDGPGQPSLCIAIFRIELHGLCEAILLLLQAIH